MSKSEQARVTAMSDIRAWLRSENRQFVGASKRQMDAILETASLDDVYASVRDFGYGYTINPQRIYL